MSKASNDMMDMLHRKVAEGLLERIQSGDATAAEFSAAIKFLKDNGIEALPVEGSPLFNLVDSLPFDANSLQVN
jgi:hypothetical protein